MAKARRQVADAFDAGHLLVWTWRKFVVGQAGCPLIAREYLRLAGDEADELLVVLAAFLKALGGGSRRILAMGHPHCIGLTRDESQILSLVAAAQAGDRALFAAHLRWLVQPDHQRAVTGAARMLARRLQARGLCLPGSATPPAPMRPMLEVVRG